MIHSLTLTFCTVAISANPGPEPGIQSAHASRPVVPMIWIDLGRNGTTDLIRSIPGKPVDFLLSDGEDGFFVADEFAPLDRSVHTVRTIDLDDDGWDELILAGRDGTWGISLEEGSPPRPFPTSRRVVPGHTGLQ